MSNLTISRPFRNAADCRLYQVLAGSDARPDIGILPEPPSGLLSRISGGVEHDDIETQGGSFKEGRGVVHRIHISPGDDVGEVFDEFETCTVEELAGPVGDTRMGVAFDFYTGSSPRVELVGEFEEGGSGLGVDLAIPVKRDGHPEAAARTSRTAFTRISVPMLCQPL